MAGLRTDQLEKILELSSVAEVLAGFNASLSILDENRTLETEKFLELRQRNAVIRARISMDPREYEELRISGLVRSVVRSL